MLVVGVLEALCLVCCDCADDRQQAGPLDETNGTAVQHASRDAYSVWSHRVYTDGFACLRHVLQASVRRRPAGVSAMWQVSQAGLRSARDKQRPPTHQGTTLPDSFRLAREQAGLGPKWRCCTRLVAAMQNEPRTIVWRRRCPCRLI
jgi:hypothetical protein